MGRLQSAKQGTLAFPGGVPAMAAPLNTWTRLHNDTDTDPATLGFALSKETVAYGTFTRTLDRHQDEYLRPSGWTMGTENAVSYEYHATEGRLETVTSGTDTDTDTFTYAYEDEDDSYGLVKTVTGPAHTVANTWEDDRDVLNTKTNTETIGATSIPSSFDYTVNAIGQRTGLATTFDLGGTLASNPGTTVWHYDSHGQLVSADAPGTDPAPDRAYAFDAIGNRLFSEISNTQISDPPGANTTSYYGDNGQNPPAGVNALNQYKRIVRPGGTIDPVHDFDGNLTSGQLRTIAADGTPTTYTGALVWNAERCNWTGSIMDCGAAAARRARHAMPRMSRQNRLVKVTNATTNEVIEFAYDHLGRRISKTVTPAGGGNGSNVTFIYDNTGEGPEPGWTTRQGCPKGGAAGRGGDVNWNLIAERYDRAGSIIDGGREPGRELLRGQTEGFSENGKFVVYFKLDLVCASEKNKVMKTVKWGYTYSFHAKKNLLKVKLR